MGVNKKYTETNLQAVSHAALRITHALEEIYAGFVFWCWVEYSFFRFSRGRYLLLPGAFVQLSLTYLRHSEYGLFFPFQEGMRP